MARIKGIKKIKGASHDGFCLAPCLPVRSIGTRLLGARLNVTVRLPSSAITHEELIDGPRISAFSNHWPRCKGRAATELTPSLFEPHGSGHCPGSALRGAFSADGSRAHADRKCRSCCRPAELLETFRPG